MSNFHLRPTNPNVSPNPLAVPLSSHSPNIQPVYLPHNLSTEQMLRDPNNESQRLQQEDDRKKFERERYYQLQQKRLQEMNLTGNKTAAQDSNADKLIKNILQKVDTDAKIMRRTMTGTKYQNFTPQPSVAQTPINNISSISGSMHFHQPQDSSFQQNASQLQYFTGYKQNLQPTSGVSQVFNSSISTNMPIATSLDASNSSANVPLTLNTSQLTHLQVQQTCLRMTTPLSVPRWCQDTSKIPVTYENVWKIVQIAETCFCDTTKLYPLLLSSGLSREFLAQLWTNVNHTVPGQLTKMELFIALAVIANVQQNPMSVNPLVDVFQVEIPSIPILSCLSTNELVDNHCKQIEQNNVTSQSELESLKKIDTLENARQGETESGSNEIKSQTEFSFFAFEKSDQNSNELEQNNESKFADFSHFNELNESKKWNLENQSLNDEDIDKDFDTLNSANSLMQDENTDISTNKSEIILPNKKSLSEALMSNITALQSSHPKNDNSSTITESSEPLNVNSDNTFIVNWPSTEADSTFTISSLKTTVAGDKYSAFKELNLEDNTSTNDFADFRNCNANFDAESVDSLQLNSNSNENCNDIDSIQLQMLQCCRQLLYKVFNVLVVNHGEKSSLEAISTQNGKAFILDFFEVYRVAKRIGRNVKSLDSNETNSRFEHHLKLYSDIETTWTTLLNLFSKLSFDFDLSENFKENSEKKSSKECAICQQAEDDRLTKLLAFAGFEYHSNCANLWLNCINATLPQPHSSAHS